MLHFAYLDAGTGSLFIQSIIGVVLAGSVIFRNVLSKTTGKLKRIFYRNKDVAEDA